jgi:hypothetical protein
MSNNVICEKSAHLGLHYTPYKVQSKHTTISRATTCNSVTDVCVIEIRDEQGVVSFVLIQVQERGSVLQLREQDGFHLINVGLVIEGHLPLGTLCSDPIDCRSVPWATVVADLEELVHRNRRTTCDPSGMCAQVNKNVLY